MKRLQVQHSAWGDHSGSAELLGLEIPTGLYPKTKQKASLTEAQRGIKVMFALITHRTVNTLTGLGMK